MRFVPEHGFIDPPAVPGRALAAVALRTSRQKCLPRFCRPKRARRAVRETSRRRNVATLCGRHFQTRPKQQSRGGRDKINQVWCQEPRSPRGRTARRYPRERGCNTTIRERLGVCRSFRSVRRENQGSPALPGDSVLPFLLCCTAPSSRHPQFSKPPPLLLGFRSNELFLFCVSRDTNVDTSLALMGTVSGRGFRR